MSKVLTGMRPRCVTAYGVKGRDFWGGSQPLIFFIRTHGLTRAPRNERAAALGRSLLQLGVKISGVLTTLLDRQIGLVAKMRRDQRRSVEARLANHKRPICWNRPSAHRQNRNTG